MHIRAKVQAVCTDKCGLKRISAFCKSALMALTSAALTASALISAGARRVDGLAVLMIICVRLHARRNVGVVQPHNLALAPAEADVATFLDKRTVALPGEFPAFTR